MSQGLYYPPLLRAICNPFIKFSRAGDVKFYAPDEIIKFFENTGFKHEMFVKEGYNSLSALGKLRYR